MPFFSPYVDRRQTRTREEGAWEGERKQVQNPASGEMRRIDKERESRRERAREREDPKEQRKTKKRREREEKKTCEECSQSREEKQ